MNLHQITFSPTGGTLSVCESICKGIASASVATELCVAADDLRLPRLTTDDLAVIAMPVFAGRVPALALQRLKQIESNSARCVVVAVYGNRAYDDAMLELHDAAKAMGFRVIAAIGAVAQHSIINNYGNGRPDADDKAILQEFGKKIAQKAASGNLTEPSVPGNRPYKKPMEGPHPTADRHCNACGICAKNCPVGAISTHNIRKTDKQKCISCMRCVAECPIKARGIGKVMHFIIAQMIKKPCASRKSNEIYL
ncbi:MAG: 4Fe-4S binding protein [Muribaculaceae bacterium]